MMLEGVQDGKEATSPGRREGERGELGTGPRGCGGIVVSIWETKYNLQLKLRVGGNGTVRKESWKVSVATPLGLRIQKDPDFNSKGVGSHGRF